LEAASDDDFESMDIFLSKPRQTDSGRTGYRPLHHRPDHKPLYPFVLQGKPKATNCSIQKII